MPEPPLYSIVIPTRERHDVLASCLQTVANQTAGNFEAVVMDNSSGPETRKAVELFGDHRVHYHRAPRRVSMSENWETGLGFARGEYVLFLGDDDGLLPDCVEIATSIHARFPDLALGWRTSLWYWPGVYPQEKQGYLRTTISPRLENRDCEEWLRKVLDCETSYAELPGIYSSFVPRSLIDAVKARSGGRYFASPIPDVWSGVVNCFDRDRFLFMHRPLSLRAVSHHSTGHSQLYHNSCGKAAERFKDENRGPWDLNLDKRLVEGPIFEADMLIADAILKASELATDREFSGLFSFEAFANQLAKNSLPRFLDIYEDAVDVILELSRKNSVVEPAVSIPSLEHLQELESQGSGVNLLSRWGDHVVQMNTAPHLIRNVADACAFLTSLLPPPREGLNGS